MRRRHHIHVNSLKKEFNMWIDCQWYVAHLTLFLQSLLVFWKVNFLCMSCWSSHNCLGLYTGYWCACSIVNELFFFIYQWLCGAAFTVIRAALKQTLKTLDRELFVCERTVLHFTETRSYYIDLRNSQLMRFDNRKPCCLFVLYFNIYYWYPS